MFKRSLLLLTAILLPALAGCDTLTDTGEADIAPPAEPQAKLRHWDLLAASPTGTAQRGDGADADSVDFIVTFSDLVDDPQNASGTLFYAQGVKTRTYYRDSFTGVAVTVHQDDLYGILNDLVASDSVAFVEPDIPLDPIVDAAEYVDLETYRDADGGRGITYDDDAWYQSQLRPWTIERIEGDDSSTQSGNGSGTVDIDVYVIDGPMDHPDLNVVERVSFLPAGVTPASTLHGNHVAGIIAAIDDGDGIVGVAPGARLHSLEVLDAAGATTLSTLLDAVEFVTTRKQADPDRPLVVNMSIGVDLGTTALNALDEAVAKAVQAGVVFVASAGNGATDASTYSPAHAPGALVVAASDPYDTFARTFSNFGAEIDLFAPGVDVLSAADGGRFAILSGTSMATPHVAGAAALVLSRAPAATPAQVLSALRDETGKVRAQPRGTTNKRLEVEEF